MTRHTVVTFLGTMGFSASSYVVEHYDKMASFALTCAGLAFLAWRWRKSSKMQLCDKLNCPNRHEPSTND